MKNISKNKTDQKRKREERKRKEKRRRRKKKNKEKEKEKEKRLLREVVTVKERSGVCSSVVHAFYASVALHALSSLSIALLTAKKPSPLISFHGLISLSPFLPLSHSLL